MSKTGVFTLLKQIKEKKLCPRQLAKRDRQRCVQHLETEGMEIVEIAELLGCSDRTIRRDRNAIRDRLKLEDDPELDRKMAGELMHTAETCARRIRRATREKTTPAAVRIEGERAVFEIINRAVERLQSLGMLPSAERHVRGELRLRSDGDLSLTEIIAEAERLDAIEQKHGARRGPPDARPTKKVTNLARSADRRKGAPS